MSKQLLYIIAATILLLSSCNNENMWILSGNFENGKYSFVDTPPNGWKDFDFDDSEWISGTFDKKNIPENPTLLFRKTFEINNPKQVKVFLIQMPRYLHFKLYLNGKLFFEHTTLQIGTPNPDFWFKDSLPIFDEKFPRNFFFHPQTLNFISGKNLLAIEFLSPELKKINFSQIAFFFNSHLSPINPENIPNSKPESYLNTSNLPIFKINTFGQTIDIENKTPAYLTINLPKGEKNNKSTYIGIEFRGQTSMSYPKKSFTIETRTKKGKNKKVNLLGLPKDKDWVLNGPYADKTLIRNAFIFHLSNLIGRYAPRTKFIELVINGEYQGVYLLMEKIKPDKNRVNIQKFKSGNKQDDSIQCGYIIAIDKGCKDGWKTTLPKGNGTKHFFCYYYPKPDKITNSQQKYIHNYIRKFEDYLNNQQSVDSLIDMSSFVDYFILNELARNIDAYRLSTYFYLPVNGKLTMGPLWDFNYSFGYVNYLDATNPEGWVFEELPEFVPFWWKNLLQNSAFKVQLKSRWTELRKTIFSDKNLLKLIDKEVAKIGNAKDRNFKRWQILDTKLWMEEKKYGNYPEYAKSMKQWTLKRVKWMDKKINEL